MYVVLGNVPESEYVVAVEPVFDDMTDQVRPELVDLSISYPDIAAPPVLVGAVQLRLIWDDDTAAAARPVGDPGTVIRTAVVADAVAEGKPVPAEFIADTR